MKGREGREGSEGREKTDLAAHASNISVMRRDWREREVANKIAGSHYSRLLTNERPPRIPLNFAVIYSVSHRHLFVSQKSIK